MKVEKSTVQKDGSCNYCDKGKLSLGGHSLVYPYALVFVVKGNYIKSVFCEDCLSELSKIESKVSS